MDKNTTKKWDAARQSKYYKEWREKNKKKLAAYQKKWHAENKKHLDQYHKDNKDKISKQQKEWREEHPEQVKKLWNVWYKMNKIRSPKRRFTEAKHTAGRRKIEWKLTLEEYSVLIILPCFYCENQLGEPVKRSIGLDRLNSNIGYELSNVVSCCYVCNCIKNEFLTPEETKTAVQAILELRKRNILLNKP